ncbi:hypothetical protein LA080_006011 [Diaporthe eres]|nr:hypothetical protein LA080_006011 [Diaporthe eres]
MDPGKICEAAEACRKLFGYCVSNVSNRDCIASMRSEQGDFNLWCAAVEATSMGKASLDYHLRDHMDIRDVVCDWLASLRVSLDKYERRADELGNEDVLEDQTSALDSSPRTESLASWDAISDEWSSLNSLAYDGADPASWLQPNASPLIRANILRKNRIQFCTKQRGENPYAAKYSTPRVDPRGDDKSNVVRPPSAASSTMSRDVDSTTPPVPIFAAPTTSHTSAPTTTDTGSHPDVTSIMSGHPPSTASNLATGTREDILPYTCFVEGCSTPDEMYLTSETFLAHLIEEHSSLRWVCDFCALGDTTKGHPRVHHDFLSAEQWEMHIQEAHGHRVKGIQQAELAELAELNKRPMIGPLSCPLCDFAMPNMSSKVDRHIFQHLHEFSLRALPEPAKNGDTNGSIASGVTVMPSHIAGFGVAVSESERSLELPDPNLSNVHADLIYMLT